MTVTHDEVKQFFGDIDDHLIVEIQTSGATSADLSEVAAHLAQETDVMGELERPLTGTALRIYNLLRQGEQAWEEDR